MYGQSFNLIFKVSLDGKDQFAREYLIANFMKEDFHDIKSVLAAFDLEAEAMRNTIIECFEADDKRSQEEWSK